MYALYMFLLKHKTMFFLQLFQLLESKTREFSESVIQEFRQLYDIIVISPGNIEKVAEMRGNKHCNRIFFAYILAHVFCSFFRI